MIVNDEHSCTNAESSAFWQQGYGSEAVQAVLDYGFDRVGLHRIEAFCDCQNQASAGLLRHLGFQQEGLHRGMCRLANGQFVDCLSFGLCADERPESEFAGDFCID